MNRQFYNMIPAILGLFAMIIIVMGIFGVIVSFETQYNTTATNYTIPTDGLLIDGNAGQQVDTTTTIFTILMPNMMWMVILGIVLTIIYIVYRMTRRKRGKLITKWRRL